MHSTFTDIYLFPAALERAAMRWPESIVFRCRNNNISFAHFHQQVTTVAALLRDHGVCRGDRVGVMMHKSIESAIGIYAAMTAGAAYVPIDPLTPKERLQFIINDCTLSALLVDDSTSLKLSTISPDPVKLIIGGDYKHPNIEHITWPLAVQFPTQMTLHNRSHENDLAYVMYTSGSTGTPKGLMHTHKSGLTYARQAAKLYGLSPGDKLGNHSALHFDMSTLEYFAGPLYGATSVIITEEYLRMPASLSSLIETEKLTIWHSVPFAIIQLLEHGQIESKDFSTIRWLLFGGEPFSPHYLNRIMQLLPQVRVGNLYGPAELNQTTFYEIPRTLLEDDVTVPIGDVWENSDRLILDDQNNLLNNDGDVGELVVRSPTMMDGYWGRPDLTEKVFFDHQLNDGRNARYLRTGDLVRIDNPTQMTFIGRKDRQVKVRGFRIELDEIEMVAYQHESVEEAAAVKITDVSNIDQIALAIILKKDFDANEKSLRQHLAKYLPTYARPTSILFRETFPRTSSSKINRPQLKAIIETNNEHIEV